MGIFSKIREGLKKTRENISGQISAMVNSFTKIDEALFEELEELLVMGDVGVNTSQFICGELRNKIKEKGITDPSLIMGELKAIVAQLLEGDDTLHLSTHPAMILVIGVNGVGKTTTIGKLASRLKSQGHSVILGAADTFRAAAIEQLEVWADRAGVPIVKHKEGTDPAAVVFDTIAAAKSRECDVIICDTAGRLHNKKNLMDELSKISRIIDRELPGCDRETLLVLDAATGQNAVNQAKEFQSAAGITGIVLTKLDGTAKGGVVLPIKQDLGLSVKFIGVGEQVDDLQPFQAEEFAEALFSGAGEAKDEAPSLLFSSEAPSLVASEPEDLQPELIRSPEAIVEPGVIPEPEAIVEPEVIPEPEAVFEPEVLPEPEAASEPEIAPEPVVISQPETVQETAWMASPLWEESTDLEEESGENALQEELEREIDQRLSPTAAGLIGEIDAMLEEQEPPQESDKKKKRRFWPFGKRDK